eukprot:729412-Prymnesium_polylepis.2
MTLLRRTNFPPGDTHLQAGNVDDRSKVGAAVLGDLERRLLTARLERCGQKREGGHEEHSTLYRTRCVLGGLPDV